PAPEHVRARRHGHHKPERVRLDDSVHPGRRSGRPRECGPADPQHQVRRPVRGVGPRVRATPPGRAHVAELPRSPRHMSPSRQTADRLLFEELVHETRDDLLAYAMRRAASPEDAADVLSETYLIAGHKLEQVPPGDSARLWLFGVAANVLRRGAQRQRSSQALIERLPPAAQDAGENETGGREDRTVRALRAGLAGLP